VRPLRLSILIPLLSVLAGVLAFGGSFHAILIDGVNDFNTDETLAGTSGSIWYMTWDASNFYLATQNTDVGSVSNSKWVVCYFDTDPRTPRTGGTGSTTGLMFNTQRPNLPFTANFLVVWRLDTAATMLYTYNDPSWIAVASPNVQVSRSGNYVEMKIPRASIGSPSSIYVCAAMINESSGSEWTYNLTPAGQSDGYNANFTRTFAFPLGASISPNAPLYLDGSLSVTDASRVPREMRLLQNHPNPFNPSTVITYELPRTSQVVLTVYDLLGRRVGELVNDRREAGIHQVRFDGSFLSSGVYFYRLEVGDLVQTRKMLMVR
jgi:hypothetical protein